MFTNADRFLSSGRTLIVARDAITGEEASVSLLTHRPAKTEKLTAFGEPRSLNSDVYSEKVGDFGLQITTDGQGTWIAIWSSDNSLGGTIGADLDILMVRSTDDGDNWTEPMVLNANARRDVGNDWHPQLTTDGRGTWVAIWSIDEPQVGTIGFGDYIVVARSTNEGGTWTEPVPMSTSSVFDEASSNFPQLSTDKSGVLIATWISDTTLGGTIGRDLDILIVRSTDGGANWSMPRALNTAARSDGMTDNEPQLASDGSGNWVAVWKSYQTAQSGEGLRIAESFISLLPRSRDAPQLLLLWVAAKLNLGAPTSIVSGTQEGLLLPSERDDTPFSFRDKSIVSSRRGVGHFKAPSRHHRG
jgi:hypothetical protein